MILPPGTILQQMYLRERLRKVRLGRFIEIGTGQGQLSAALLDLGWSGSGYELNSQSIAAAAQNNRSAIDAGRYQLLGQDWLSLANKDQVDLIASSMVIEHLDDTDEQRYFARCRDQLGAQGLGILFVPGCPEYWGMEDSIAGHYRRYTFASLRQRIEACGLVVRHIAGLTYPVSNLLFPLSEFLVRRSERHKLDMGMQERTELSGNRKVPFKTTFPGALRLVLNQAVMYPFHILQKLNARNSKSLTIYAEFLRPT